MKIKLLADIVEHDKDGNEVGLKIAKRKNKAWTPPRVVDGNIVECGVSQFIYTPFVQGAIIEASEATATKWIEAGKAVAIAEKQDAADTVL